MTKSVSFNGKAPRRYLPPVHQLPWHFVFTKKLTRKFVDRKKSLFCLVLARCFFREAGGFTEQILDVPADPVISLRIADVYFQILRSHPGKYLCLWWWILKGGAVPVSNDGDGEISLLPFEQQTKLTFGSAAVDSKRTTFLLNLLFLQHVFPRSFGTPYSKSILWLQLNKTILSLASIVFIYGFIIVLAHVELPLLKPTNLPVRKTFNHKTSSQSHIAAPEKMILNKKVLVGDLAQHYKYGQM